MPLAAVEICPRRNTSTAVVRAAIQQRSALAEGQAREDLALASGSMSHVRSSPLGHDLLDLLELLLADDPQLLIVVEIPLALGLKPLPFLARCVIDAAVPSAVVDASAIPLGLEHVS